MVHNILYKFDIHNGMAFLNIENSYVLTFILYGEESIIVNCLQIHNSSFIFFDYQQEL